MIEVFELKFHPVMDKHFLLHTLNLDYFPKLASNYFSYHKNSHHNLHQRVLEHLHQKILCLVEYQHQLFVLHHHNIIVLCLNLHSQLMDLKLQDYQKESCNIHPTLCLSQLDCLMSCIQVCFVQIE